jgi:hypothetical protein
MTSTPNDGYELDPAEVRYVVNNQYDPEIKLLAKHTATLTGSNATAGSGANVEPSTMSTTPMATGTAIFGQGGQLVSPLGVDAAGLGYAQALNELSALFDSKFQTFLANQVAFLGVMADFRQRLLDSVDAYEKADQNYANHLGHIAGTMEEGAA